jgi:hypothetical protein
VNGCLGSAELGMHKRIDLRWLTVALILAVGALGIHAAIHWQGPSYDEQHCQICQIGHAAIPQPAVETPVQAPVPVARFAPAEEPTPDLEAIETLSIPRAPPA